MISEGDRWWYDGPGGAFMPSVFLPSILPASALPAKLGYRDDTPRAQKCQHCGSRDSILGCGRSHALTGNEAGWPNHMQTYRDDHLYDKWVGEYDTLGDLDRQAIRTSMRQLPWLPQFSIVLLPTPDGTVSAAHAAITSVVNQIYPRWELWLPFGAASTNNHVDGRFRVVSDTGTSTVSHTDLFNAALAASQGDFVLPLPPDAILSEHALYELAVAIGDDSKAAVLYTDEDRLDAAGNRCMPRFKTGWDPDLALGRDAIGLLVAYRKTLLDRLGGVQSRDSGVGLALYDLSLRAAFAVPPTHIHHIPAVLCHRRGSSEASLGWDSEGAREIVRSHLAKRGVSATVMPAPLAPGWNRILRNVPYPAPLVSVIVPIRDRAELLKRCADAVLTRTDYPEVELLVVDNDSQELATAEVLKRLSQHPRVRILQGAGPFNYSALNNLAARQARGDIFLLLNNDTDVIRPDWLHEMVSHALRPDVGAVGAKLLYPDERVQHGGMVLGPDVWPSHQLRFADRLDPGPDGELALTRTVSIVTGACLALRRSVFVEVGGLNEELSVAFNDIDLCLRIGDHGYRIIWTPFAELFHLESASRGLDNASPDKLALADKEAQYFRRFWKSLISTDPFHNPNIVYGWDSWALSSPTRRKRPWIA